MPRKARPNPKPKRRPTQIRAWRKSKGLSLERLAERLLVEKEMEVSVAQLSRIERGDQPYGQDLLEALADIFGTSDSSLLNVDPTTPEPIYSIWETLAPVERRQALEVIKALRRTGTEG